MVCDNCKKFFIYGNHPVTGIPNGVKAILKDGDSITLCAKCIMSIGAMNEAERDAFFDALKAKTNKPDLC